MSNVSAWVKQTNKWVLAAGIIFLLLPTALKSEYYLNLVIMVMMWSVLGFSWNLLGGYGGQVSFGHAAFFGVGAYTACLLHLKAGVPMWAGFIFSGLSAALIAIPIGWICFRLRGPYFSLSVLALSEVLRLLTLHWKSLTEGAVGILLIFPIFDSKVSYYYFIFFFLIGTCLLMAYIIKSRPGFYLVAIREDEDAAESLGISTLTYKLYGLVVSAFLTGMMGCFFANYTTFIDPYIVYSIVDVSIAVVLVVALGGIGTFWGPVIGATVVVLLSEFLRTYFSEAHVLVYGILIIIVILYLPEGIVGGISAFLKKTTKAERRV